MAFNSSSNPSSNDSRWVIEIRNFFEEEIDDDGIDMPVCIFNVPKTLKAIKPEAYTPQLIALGPYHHWREDVYEMERYKLVCAKRVLAQFKSLQFQHLVDKIMKTEYRVRACYHKYLEMDGETLAWMMALDGLFLLEFLQAYAYKNASVFTSSARMNHLVDSAGKKLACDSILRDILMLENQVPVFLLTKILRVQHSSSDLADNLLPPMLVGVCKKLSPIKFDENYLPSKVLERVHLLDILYHLLVHMPDLQLHQDEEEQIKLDLKKEDEQIKEDEEEPSLSIGNDMKTLSKAWSILSKLNIGVVRKLKDAIKPMKVVAKLPIKIISKVPILSAIAPALEQFVGSGNKESIKPENESSTDDSKPPSVEEIMVPSVSQLCEVGVEFCPTGGDLTSIMFDSKARKFHLPVVHIDSYAEAVMRNLVAYEALALSGPLVLARYTELMNGIIDTSEDVKLLREKKIIINRLKSDKEVADLWNGMSKCLRLTKVPHIDKAILDANTYYDNSSKVKHYRLMMKYVYGSWRILIVLATILLLGLMGLQSFCSVYSCPRLFNTVKPSQ
ncbi:hypothetical protein Ancab_006774 [Ancistrocladus abbreviatus]